MKQQTALCLCSSLLQYPPTTSRLPAELTAARRRRGNPHRGLDSAMASSGSGPVRSWSVLSGPGRSCPVLVGPVRGAGGGTRCRERAASSAVSGRAELSSSSETQQSPGRDGGEGSAHLTSKHREFIRENISSHRRYFCVFTQQGFNHVGFDLSSKDLL